MEKYIYVHDFKPSSCEGSDCWNDSVINGSLIFQSTLPRRERHTVSYEGLIPGQISIHAPAKGATATDGATRGGILDFNPRSREGSDRLCSLFRQHTNYFNPRSREGSDGSETVGIWTFWIFQSTLPRRERLGCQRTAFLFRYFNPRSREGSDYFAGYKLQIITDFNPRSREGSDGNNRDFIYAYPHFNPRSREGSDYIFRLHHAFFAISIHAPAKGATKLRFKLYLNP